MRCCAVVAHGRLLSGVVPAALVAAAVLVAGCGSSKPAASALAGPEKADLVVAAVPGEGAAGLYIAEDQGLFAKVGLHVKIEASTSSSTVVPDMLHGSVDVASGQYTTYVASYAAGIKMRILASGTALGPDVHEVLVAAHSPIRTAAQLKGATIAVNAPNSETTDLLYTALSADGVSPSQVKVAVLPFPAMSAALASHVVQAIYEIQPYATEATQQQGDQVLVDIDSGAARNMPISGYAVLASWYARYPRTAAAFAKAIDQANAMIVSDPSVFRQALEKNLHLSPGVVDVMPTGTFPTTVNTVQLQRLVDLMLRYHQLSASINVSNLAGH
jgi:NitT/TauT family transport system substrate-binding protein